MTALHVIEDARLTDHAPEAIGKALAQLVERDRPVAVAGPASDRGAEILAYAARPRPACRWRRTAPRSGPAIRGR